jgi:hypothetical protein
MTQIFNHREGDSKVAAPAIVGAAFLPFNASPSRRRIRRVFTPAPGDIVIEPKGNSSSFETVRLRKIYFRYCDGPRWASQIFSPGDELLCFAAEAEALIASGAAVPMRKN